ncbi:MAG: WD40/YVTN/BNR-like repeat-containing protein [Phycisphaerales bacterium]
MPRAINFVSVVSVIAVLAGCTGVSKKPRGFDDALAAARMKYEMRLSAGGIIPHDGLMNARAHRDVMLAHFGPAGAPDAGAWNWIGPGNVGGRLRGILIHPTNPNTTWIGAASGGVWKTTDGGTSWLPLDDFLPSLAANCLVADPNDPNVIYCGTGEGFFETIEGTSNTAAVRGAGILKSTDGGTTWAQLPSTAGSPNWYFVNRLAFQSGSNQVMVAATTTGLWRTTTAGGSWTQAYSGYMYDVRYHPTDPLKAVAGGHDIAPRYSLDGGVTWLGSTGFATLPHRAEVMYAPSDPNTVYASVAIGNTLRLWRSTNGGQSYTVQTSNSGIASLNPYTCALWVDPVNINHILMGGQQMFRSTNAGVTFTQTFTGLHADHHTIAQHPGYNGTTNKTLYFGTDGGIYRTTDSAGTAVTKVSGGLGITQFYGAAVHDASGVVVAGAQDNGSNRYTGNPQSWNVNVLGGDGTYAASDPTDPNVFYASFQRLAIQRSTNAGSTFSTSVNGGLTDAGSLNCNFIAYFMLDPNNPNRMLAAGRRIWRSNNIKTGAPPTWSIIRPSIEAPEPPPLPRDPPPDHYVQNSPFNSSAIVVAQGNPDIIWVGYNNGQVARTTDGTAANPSWTVVDQNGVGLPDRWISRIVLDPANPQRGYVSIMGYETNNVWRTTDNGASWTDISGSGVTGLPDVPVQSLALHPTQPGRLFAGTDLGLFETTNDGQTWAPIVPGVGTASVDELVWRNGTTLMAVTHGRGVYFGDVPPGGCYPDCNASGSLTVADFGCFQGKYVLGDLYADCNASGTLTVADFGCFQGKYVLGCP